MDELLTKEQVESVVQFAEGIWAGERFGWYTPWVQNQIMVNLNNNARPATFEAIRKALADYKANEKNLQGYTEFMEKFDMIFARTLMSYVNTLAFDLEITCTNAYTQSDYESSAYEEDKRRVWRFLDAFDYQSEFRKVALEVMRRETFYTWFRKTKWGNKGMKFALQIMPQEYCMLTGYWEKGLLFDFDMGYFLEPGVDIDGFDPVFKEYYNRVFGPNATISNYRPTNPLDRRDGTFTMWTQTSPDNGAWAFKFNMSNFSSVPYLAPFLKDAIKNDEVAELQMNKDIASAYAILAGEIRLFDATKTGQKANQFAIDPHTLGTYMGKAKAGLGETVKLAALPTENTKWYQFNDSTPEMYTNQLSTSAGVGSGVSRVIYSSDRMSAEEVRAGIIDQYNTMKPLYRQFSNFLDYYVNKLTKHYKFHFEFTGCSYPFEREHRIDKLIKMADKGIMLGPSVWASAYGMRPQDFERQMMEAKYSGWDKLWKLPLNTNTTAGSGSEGGRPELDVDDLSDSGEMNRDQ